MRDMLGEVVGKSCRTFYNRKVADIIEKVADISSKLADKTQKVADMSG